jgi:hypothetical protein
MTDEPNAEDGEENVYSENTREGLLDDSQISPEEEGFMAGYDEAGEEEQEEDEEDEKKEKEKEE